MVCASAAGCFVAAALGQEAAPASNPAVWFVDATAGSGLDAFVQVNGDPGKSHITGSTGAGVALLDFDEDGDLDVFLISGARTGVPPGDAPAATNRLYRNAGPGERFEDVTVAAGLHSGGAFGQGCAVADVNGDAFGDLFVANIGADALYLSQGDGTYLERAAECGVADAGWSSGGAFLDYDGDGDLDLWVTRYLRLESGWRDAVSDASTLADWKGQRVFQGPMGLTPEKDRLYRNEGDGTFRDVSFDAGIDAAEAAFGFQPVTLDFDRDGRTDVFVANDSVANHLWWNRGDGTFTERAGEFGVAFNEWGRAQSCMGVAAADVDGDGREDLFVTNFSDQANVFYRSSGAGYFDVATALAGLAGPEARRSLGWGASFFDADNDGDLDLFVANGHVYPQADAAPGGYAYGQTNFLYSRAASGVFENGSARAGPGLDVAHPSRGSAAGDLDDDGDLDVVVNNLDRPPTFLRNDSPSSGAMISVRLRGKGANRSAIGARVRVVTGGRVQSRELRSSSSYVSHEDLRAHFGVGDSPRVDRIEVVWPDRSEESIEAPPLDHEIVVGQGLGIVAVSRRRK